MLLEVTVNSIFGFPAAKGTLAVQEPVPDLLPILIMAFGSCAAIETVIEEAVDGTLTAIGSDPVDSPTPSIDMLLNVVFPATVTAIS